LETHFFICSKTFLGSSSFATSTTCELRCPKPNKVSHIICSARVFVVKMEDDDDDEVSLPHFVNLVRQQAAAAGKQ